MKLVRIWIVQSRALDAFTFGHPDVFISWGIILESRTPDQIAGVIAHELAHIKAGHSLKLQEQVEFVDALRIASLALAIPAAIAIARNDTGDTADLVSAGVSLSSSASLASVFGFRREKEREADLVGYKLMQQAGFDPNSLTKLLRRFDAFSVAANQQPGGGYFMTHPPTRERIRVLELQATKSGQGSASRDERLFVWSRLRTRLAARFLPPERARAFFAGKDDGKDTQLAHYGEALIALKTGDLPVARKLAKALYETVPDDPFYVELLGDILRESGEFVASAKMYNRAAQLLPGSELLHLAAGETMVNAGQVDSAALEHLRAAVGVGIPLRRSWIAKAKLHAKRGETAAEGAALAEIDVIDGSIGRASGSHQCCNQGVCRTGLCR